MATVAENLLKVNEGIDKVESLNAELEQTLYGGDTGYRGYYDEFWDDYQQNGKKDNYEACFVGRGWSAKTFKPKYDFTGFWGANQMFWNSFIECDLVEHLSNLGVVLDFSKVTNFTSAFAYSHFTRIGVVDMTNGKVLSTVFANSTILVTIDEIILPSTQSFNNWFTNCSSLEEVRFKGTIVQNGLNLQWSTKLSKASITNIINALSTTTSGLTVTLSKTAVESAFGSTTSTEWTNLIGTRSNWTISLV